MPHKLFYNQYVKDNFDISFSSVNKTLNNNFLITKNTKRKTGRRIRSVIKNIELNNMDKTTKQLIELNFKYDNFLEIIQSKKIPYVKHEYEFGEIVEIDACVHKWFNNEKYFIYHVIDVGTGMLLAASIEKEETNTGYVELLKNLIKIHGYPNLIKTDKRKTFWSHDSKTNMTQCLNNLELKLNQEVNQHLNLMLKGSLEVLKIFTLSIFIQKT